MGYSKHLMRIDRVKRLSEVISAIAVLMWV